jgi:hypothetical protein
MEFSLLGAIDAGLWLIGIGLPVIGLGIGTTIGATLLGWIVREVQDIWD